jgi:CRISPR-associated protein (TIGR02710 family)
MRRDLVKVVNGSESTHVLHTPGIKFSRQMKLVQHLFKRFAYAEAVELMEDLGKTPGLRAADSETLARVLPIARGFDEWDKFDHTGAWNRLRHFQSDYPAALTFLEAVLWSRSDLDPEFKHKVAGLIDIERKGHGYELIQDLVLNAERRAVQGRYDDAIGRLYRALELFAQARLKHGHGIDTGNVELARLPKKMRSKYERKANPRDGKIQIPLKEAYEMLGELSSHRPEPLGELYRAKKRELIDFLQHRNYALFAHGFTPVTKNTYRRGKEFLDSFCREGLKVLMDRKLVPGSYAADPVQFPQSLSW